MDQSKFEADRTKKCILESEAPECTKSKPCWLGIDEAGRGPVLGPMVYGTCYSPLTSGDLLKEMGLADSKTLSEEQRDSMFEKIHKASDKVGWMVEILPPTYISNSMLRRIKYNLNALSHDCAIGLIEKVLAKGVNVQEIYVDTVGDPMKYQNKLKDLFPNISITVAKKADATYPIVSGASICAKVARDYSVKNWIFAEDIDTEGLVYGSGYPSDPNTKKFMSSSLDKVFGFTQFVRFSWSTAALIIEKEGVQVRWEDDDDEEENKDAKGSASLLTFFKRSDDDPKLHRHQYFTDRCLTSLTNL
ncbi:ribonuclease H2 subunit A [Patella vulgata]|uniref:ribonuclease H2 subunit A n=1 Tax=Patella vulgata TaxID=6465 RepID=UPI002180621C|nr:ribonuclease H2 subunit A [Patella vulgata]